MTMASFLRGKPIMQGYDPGATVVHAGDVVVVGNVPCVAHEDIPAFTGAKTLDALAVAGGVYQIAADAAYANGTRVLWDTAKQQVTTTPSAATFDFGVIVGGPTDLLSDAGPTGAASLASVLHLPVGLALDDLLAAFLPSFPRNLIDGGDMTTNPAQRGASQAADIANTLTYGPDRFAFKGGASSAINWSINADAAVAGFSKSLKWQRKSANTDTAALNMVQVVETADSIRTQGLPVTISFWAKKGANYSGGNLTVQVESGQGTDQSAANLIAGSWTSQAHVVNATQALTTTMTRYQFTGVVPAATTQLGLLLQWTPTGTAGADDSIVINGFQLEIGAPATTFEHRDVQMELEICQRYFWQINEPASGVVVGMGTCPTTTSATIYIATPVQMRAAPALTVTAGSFNVRPANAAASGTAAAGSTHTQNAITVSVTGVTATTAGFGTPLMGGGGAGVIAASADY